VLIRIQPLRDRDQPVLARLAVGDPGFQGLGTPVTRAEAFARGGMGALTHRHFAVFTGAYEPHAGTGAIPAELPALVFPPSPTVVTNAFVRRTCVRGAPRQGVPLTWIPKGTPPGRARFAIRDDLPGERGVNYR